MVDNFQGMYSRDEFTLVQYNSGDAGFAQRYDYYNCVGVPTVCGDGLSDVWPCTQATLIADYNAHSARTSPATMSLVENSEGDFTCNIYAEVDLPPSTVFTMVAVENDTVLAYGGAYSHLEYHAKAFMTPFTGEPLVLEAGENIEITRSFTVQPDWYYGQMGVVAWLQQDGGTNTSPSPDIPSKHEVLQSIYAPTNQTSVADRGISVLVMAPPAPNPFDGDTRIAFHLPDEASVAVSVFDVAGRLVNTLLEQSLPGGDHSVSWDGRDTNGRACADGIYFVRITTDVAGEAHGKLVKIN